MSGSRSADMKAAIVEAFKAAKVVLIATESGAEGINLQFCSLLINYDLPWNPQRVEQRIGRCHRYGQKIDVTVVNFLNLKNHAERRVYQLLSEKFQLFKGVFGASDEVLGAIERGVDIEKRILEIVQSARSEAEINTAFDALQVELQAQINEQVLDARKRLLENVDERVVSTLKTRNGEIRRYLSEFERNLLIVARAELLEAVFHADDERRFDYHGETYTTEWPLADERDWKFFRLLEGTLAPTVVAKAKARCFDGPSTVRFDVSSYTGGRLANVEPLRGQSGWLRVSKLALVTQAVRREHLVLAVASDAIMNIYPDTIERLLTVPATNLGAANQAPPEDGLTAAEGERKSALVEEAERQNEKWLELENDKLDNYADDLERAFEAEIKAVEAEIKAAQKALRGSSLPMAEKLNEKRRITGLQAKRDKMKVEYFDKRAAIRAEVEAMLDQVQESLKMQPELAPLLTIRWEVA